MKSEPRRIECIRLFLLTGWVFVSQGGPLSDMKQKGNPQRRVRRLF